MLFDDLENPCRSRYLNSKRDKGRDEGSRLIFRFSDVRTTLDRRIGGGLPRLTPTSRKFRGEGLLTMTYRPDRTFWGESSYRNKLDLNFELIPCRRPGREGSSNGCCQSPLITRDSDGLRQPLSTRVPPNCSRLYKHL